ncbi:MAG: hypothetical protein ABMB14_02625 [Myxococcota bacterium]
MPGPQLRRLVGTAALGVAAAGCPDPTHGSTVGLVDTDRDDLPPWLEPDRTGETGQPAGDGWFTPTLLRLDATFAYDADRREIRPYTVPSGDVVPHIQIAFGNDDWLVNGFDPGDTDNYCVILLPLTSSSRAGWSVGDPDVWFGVDYVGDPPITDCDVGDKAWNPALFGSDPVGDIVGYGAWGAGVGEIDPQLALYFTTTTYYETTFIGGRLMSPLIFESWGFFTVPIRLAPTFAAETAEGDYVTVPPDEVRTDDGVVTGAYELFSLFYWRLP